MKDFSALEQALIQRPGTFSLRHMTWLLLGLAIPFFVVWQSPAFHGVEGLAGYLPLHMFAETFSIVVSMMVFGIAWNVHGKARQDNIVILACAFFAVGLIDFAHMLSFKGMPDFITPSGPEKAINLWLSARLIAALALLTVALRPWQPLRHPRGRYGMLAGSLAIAAIVIWLGLAYPAQWPRTFIAGQGLTPFKIGAEYTLIAILLVPAVRFYIQARDSQQSYTATSLFGAVVITILSELCFTLYSDVADIFNLLGHVYKIVAYAFIYRAIFVTCVRDPFLRLDAEFAENRRISKQLGAASRYTRSLIEASLDPLVTISAEGKITDVNRATEEVTGRNRADLIGTDFSNYFTDPDQARDGYKQVFLKGFVTDYPLALRHRDGRITDVLYNASVYRDESGEVLGVFAAARDITGQKRAEATRTELAAIVESSDDAIIGKDLDNIITTWNHGAEQMYGYTAQEAVGQSISLIVPGDKQQELQEINERIKQRERVKHHETTRVARDGRRIEVSLSLAPILDDRGNITRISAIARDITERKHAEEQIRKNNQLLETVFSSIHVMIAYLDRDFNFIKVNRAYAAADQRTPAFFPGKNHFDLYPDEENKAIFQNTIETGEPAVYFAKPFEFAEHPERGVSYWDWRLEPVIGAGGKVEGVLFSLLNVTEQTLSAQKIRAAAQYARSLIEASLDPLITINAEGKITDVNIATEKVTGSSREKLIGTDFSSCFIEPDKAQQGYRQVFEKGFVRDYPLEIRHRDGKITPVLYNATIYKDEQGKVIGVLAAARDITERKQAEKALRENEHFLDSVIEHIPNMVFVKDAKDLKFVRFNAAGEELLGYSRDELIGKNDYDFFPREQADFFVSKDRAIIATGELMDIQEPIDTRFSGQRYLHTRKIPVYAADGSPLYIIGISEDITELKNAEDKINELNRDLERRVAERTGQLEAANKELEAFSYSVSHDLRTPLRAIDGFSRILLDDYAGRLDDEGRRLLSVVRDNTRRMGQLIDDILKFSRTGRLDLTFSEIDMAELAREVYAELSPTAGHALQINIAQLPSAKGDRAMMRQVFVNLLSNAIKFTRARAAARIEVGGSIEGNEAVYFVKDNGAGFDMQYVNKLFGVFQRLHSVNEFEGTGIGLAIVKRIITRHGGRVWAEGKINEGATIYFALPNIGKAHE